MKNIAVLVSGGGTNLQSIIDAAAIITSVSSFISSKKSVNSIGVLWAESILTTTSMP